ncbi:hypothetical protein [Ammoniphilus sp. CFH 90114]|uniref:hypothetical protein n=1 Tax=Ammoniphilus sp. CFH 90114 TaxID=2493665 RepID=UPI00100EC194|nr:hypothetical protein [Ammoniphilus sp. CFH 90114]RXT02747.1 hypothetical protein EIZ39_24435 [Ammoniphilus sp. CFH 90114]
MNVIQGMIGDTKFSTDRDLIEFYFPDGKEYIFTFKENASLYEVDEVCQRGDGLILTMPGDLSLFNEEKMNYSRFYFFSNQGQEVTNELIHETYEWLVQQVGI